jgi:DNA-binding response OmpR family regulator
MLLCDCMDNPIAPKPVILIVEDDPVLSKMYAEKFLFEGFSVITARDGEEAYNKAVAGDISIILLDIMLPRMSGTDFLERFRATPKGKNIPVVALTNLSEEEERAHAMKLGVKEYLGKSAQTPEVVVKKIKSYVLPSDGK